MMCNRERAKMMMELGQTEEAQILLCKLIKYASFCLDKKDSLRGILKAEVQIFLKFERKSDHGNKAGRIME